MRASKSAWLAPPAVGPGWAAGAAAPLGQDVCPRPVVVDPGYGADGGLAVPGLGLGDRHLAEQGVALLRIGRLAGRLDRRGEFARGKLGLELLVARRLRGRAGPCRRTHRQSRQKQ